MASKATPATRANGVQWRDAAAPISRGVTSAGRHREDDACGRFGDGGGGEPPAATPAA
jgi:hypothetical protein